MEIMKKTPMGSSEFSLYACENCDLIFDTMFDLKMHTDNIHSVKPICEQHVHNWVRFNGAGRAQNPEVVCVNLFCNVAKGKIFKCTANIN